MKAACQITHAQILVGDCPWCDIQLSASGIEPGVERIWNDRTMSAALDDPDVEVRMTTLANLTHDGPALSIAIPLLSKALVDASAEIRSQAEHSLAHLGSNTGTHEISQMEREIAGSRDELAQRILALGFYFLGKRNSAAAREARNQHIFWIIQNAPACTAAGSPDASLHGPDEQDSYARAKNLWLEQIRLHPGNAQIMGNAACFFLHRDMPLSESLLLKARDLEPSNPKWPEQLGQLYSLQSGRTKPGTRESAGSAFRELRAAERIRQEAESSGPVGSDSHEAKLVALMMRIHKLPELAKAALEAGELEQARNYAEELLEKAVSLDLPEYFRSDGNAIHYGNIVLGRVALAIGDIWQAKQRLIGCAHTTGSPNLGSFGPNMTLAKELLERGEREVVLEFLELCKSFWTSSWGALEEWKSDVEAGRMPEFGANLRY